MRPMHLHSPKESQAKMCCILQHTCNIYVEKGQRAEQIDP